MRVVSGENVAIEVAGASVTIPAAAIAELWIQKVKGEASARAPTPDEVERAAIGTLGRYGIYAGVARGVDDTKDDYIVEVLEAEPETRLTFEEANKWAASVGGSLPTRRESALLFANVPELFEPYAYWTSEQYAGLESCAWYQTFGYGFQSSTRKDNELRARAVRRLMI
jgi:hypothetical protein